MTLMDIGLIVIFGVCFPTWDVYSDIGLAITLITFGHPNFAMAMLAPILLSTLFLIPQWLRREQTKKRILTTLPLVLFQLYPQFKMLELLYLGLWKKDSKWRSKKDELQKSVSYIGKLKGNNST